MSQRITGCPTVMLVEDYAGMRLKMKQGLETSGCRVVEETSVHDAVEDAMDFTCAERPDLIVLDLSQMTAEELYAIRLIREGAELWDVPIVVLSDSDVAVSHADALAAGCSECLKRPDDAEQLSIFIENLIPKYFSQLRLSASGG